MVLGDEDLPRVTKGGEMGRACDEDLFMAAAMRVESARFV